MKSRDPVYVTRPFLPPLEEFEAYLQKIWNSRQLTNNGEFHKKLEKELAKYFDVPYVSLFANGTLALLAALQVLNIKGEVITTPFSFVATSHAIINAGAIPVFADIDPNSFNLDPGRIEEAITSKTRAILPVHVYGNPCEVVKIKEIADKYHLKVLYDAAHAFGVKYKGESILKYGDLSILSFHATKVFNTFEGGAIVCHDEETKRNIDQLKNFGITSETTVEVPGINAKMNEFQSALGLLQLKYIDEIISKNKTIATIYRESLRSIPGIGLLYDLPEVKHNYSYFPIFIDSANYGKARDDLYEKLKEQNIFSRRYFYPLISQFPIYSSLNSAQPGKMPVSEKVSKEVLCLPIYPDLDHKELIKIYDTISNLKSQ